MAERAAETGSDDQSLRFVLLYALAWGGGAIGYTPLLSLLLPVRVAELAGKEAGVSWLAYIALAGAIAASLGGILFGYLSDVTRNRRGWVAAGLALSCVLLLGVGRATTLPGLIAMIVCWQLALNMMLGPLSAWAGDRVPDSRKGMLGGLMAFAPGMGALAGAIVTHPGLAAGETRLWLVAAMVALCVLPVLLVRAPKVPASVQLQEAQESGPPLSRHVLRARAVRMWLARLSLQVAEATMFSYLYFWLTTLDATVSDNVSARLFSAILLISAPLALVVGRWSDLRSRPIAPLRACALISALGLAVMATTTSLAGGMIAFGLFGLSSAVFLALHSAQTLRILPRPDRRGRDLGLFNLANTTPSLVMPWLVLALIPIFGFPGLFLLLGAMSALAALLLTGVTQSD